jgi:hypothetical protein
MRSPRNFQPAFSRFADVRKNLCERLTLGYTTGQSGNLRPVAAFFCSMDNNSEFHNMDSVRVDVKDKPQDRSYQPLRDKAPEIVGYRRAAHLALH